MILALFCLAGHLLVCFEFQAKRWVDEKKTFFSRKKDCWRQLLILIVSRLLTEDSTICYYWQKLCYCWWWWCDHVRLGCGHLWGENWHWKQIRKKKKSILCTVHIVLFTYFTSTWGGHKEAWRIICNYRSERKNTIFADAFFFLLGNQEPIVDKKTAKKGVNKLFIVLFLNRPVQGQPWWSDQIDINFRA